MWTAWDICDGNQNNNIYLIVTIHCNCLSFIAWADKKQYFTAKASRLDTYRAGNLMW